MNSFRRRAKAISFRHSEKRLQLLQIKIDACHALILTKIALGKIIPLRKHYATAANFGRNWRDEDGFKHK